MSSPEDDREEKGRRPKTRTLERPAPGKKPQVPSGDDRDLNQTQEPPPRGTVEDENKKTKQKPESIDPESQGDEDSGCAC